MTDMENLPLWHEGKDVNDLLDNIDDDYSFKLAINLWEDILCLKEDRLDDRKLADLVNELRLAAINYHDHQSLREKIAHIVKNALRK